MSALAGLWAFLSSRTPLAVAGPFAKAIAATAAAAVIVIGIGAGLWWMRHDARMDERAAWEAKLRIARLQALERLQSRQRASEAVGQARAREAAQEQERARARIAELEWLLATRPPQPAGGRRTVCYPKEIARKLNQ